MRHNNGTYAQLDALGKLFTHQTFEHQTWLQDESAAYPNGGQTRMGRALVMGEPMRVWVGIAETWFSCPAHIKIRGKYHAGYVSIDDTLDSPTYGALVFGFRPSENRR